MNKTLIIASLLFALVSSSFAEEKKASGEKWKDTYFEKHPEADTNKDGELSWPELHQHKKESKTTQNI